MSKCFVLIIATVLFVSSCNKVEKEEETAKMKIMVKMQEKVRKVSADLKAYCDSEIYRKAREKADSILAKRGLIRLK